MTSYYDIILWHHRLEDYGSSDSDDDVRRKKVSEMFNSSYKEVPSPDNDSEEDPLDSFMAQIEVGSK